MLNNKYQRAAKTFPRGTKSPQEQPRTPSRPPKSPPRPSKEGPRAPKSGPRPSQDGPRPPQERSWDCLGGHLGTMKQQDLNPDRPGSTAGNFLGRFWSPKWCPKRSQIDPKTSQKSRRKMHHFFIALGPVLDRSWGDLGPHLGVKKAKKHWKTSSQWKI